MAVDKAGKKLRRSTMFRKGSRFKTTVEAIGAMACHRQLD